MNYKKFIAATLMFALFTSYSGLAFALPAATETVVAAKESKSSNISETFVNNINQKDDLKILKYENLPAIKNVSSNSVQVTNYGIIIPKGNVFNVSFAQNFTTKNLKVDDKILFNLDKGLTTQEGTMLLPAGTQIVATVQTYEPPKLWNKNAKVTLNFSEILVPDEGSCSMGACVYSKHNILQRSRAATVAKPVIWTIGMFGVGAGVGAAIGAAAHAVGIGCFAIGMPVGAGVGLIVGLVTPGLHYTAKAGKEIPITLTQDIFVTTK